ncbi:hypothetical protein U0070_002076, partial [Myodes glareolus]
METRGLRQGARRAEETASQCLPFGSAGKTSLRSVSRARRSERRWLLPSDPRKGPKLARRKATHPPVKMASVPVYCLCRLPYDVTRFMIECDMCQDWFHG